MRIMYKRALAALVIWVCAAVFADEPGSWKFDVVKLKNGSIFRGLILEQTAEFVRFQDVRQRPGRPSVLFYTTFSRREIDTIEPLSDADREQLQARLLELGPEHSETQRMGRVQLEKCIWAGKANEGLRYRSDYFVLTSDASETIVRRAAVRLEQIYIAYARFLPPRILVAQPTAIELVRSEDEYAARLKAEGRSFINTGFYDPAANRIVCTGDLARLGQRLDAARREYQRGRYELDQREAALARLYKGPELARLVKPIRATRLEYDRAERINDESFDRATRQLFRIFYHEAFHAYLAGFVYPPNQPELPRWLNEGLAQIFETAVVEAGDLRIGHADADRLRLAKEAVRKGEIVPLRRLLGAGAPQFLAAHARDRRESDMYYLTAWAVTHHLMFERRLLADDKLDDYRRKLAAGANPVTEFAALVGKPIDEYERELTSYIQRLQPDGHLAAITPP